MQGQWHTIVLMYLAVVAVHGVCRIAWWLCHDDGAIAVTRTWVEEGRLLDALVQHFLLVDLKCDLLVFPEQLAVNHLNTQYAKSLEITRGHSTLVEKVQIPLPMGLAQCSIHCLPHQALDTWRRQHQPILFVGSSNLWPVTMFIIDCK